MNNNSKKMLIIASTVAGVLIAGLLIYYFVFVNNSSKEQSINDNNSTKTTTEASNNNSTNKSETANKITSGQLVESSVNEQMSSKIRNSIDLLENISVKNVSVYQHNTDISAEIRNQDSTNSGYSGSNSQGSASDAADYVQPPAASNGNNVDMVLDLTINPESKDSKEISQEMETTSNYLAETYAREMPEINVLVINYYVNKSDSISGEFTYIRSGSNLFLQEFTIS